MSGDWLNDIKTTFKRHPSLYKFLVELVSPVLFNKSKSYKMMFTHLDKADPGVIINLGSGPFKLDNRVINVDMSSYKDVSIVADIHNLPFKDNSIDGIINIAVLEHVKSPVAVIKEARRVLKKEGYIYSVIPFMQGYHASPTDYQRYTISGIDTLHEGFEKVESGVYSGPTSGFLWALQEWLSILLCFGSVKLYRALFILFTLMLWPLKFADLILTRYSMAKNIASSFYYIGYKK